MTWYITDSAIKDMARILRMRDDELSLSRAEERVHDLIANATLVRKDTFGRELYRANRHGTKLVVDYRDEPRGKVIWIGNGRPADRVWDEPAAQPRMGLECPHIPTLGEVYEIVITPVETPREQIDRAPQLHPQRWTARVCARCAEAARSNALGKRKE